VCQADAGQCPVLDQNRHIDGTESILLTTKGTPVPVIKSVVTVTLNHKHHLLESFMDISEWQMAEKTRAKNEKLQTALEITGAVCHELNQPLAAIYGFIDLSKLKLDKTSPVWETIEKIQENAERIRSITHKLLRITRYETTNYAKGMKIMDIDKSSES
jgi:signal transduction histidine kinase